MRANFTPSLKAVLAHEGGFVNRADDPGGPTNKGITLVTYSRFLGRPATIDELKNIQDRQVEAIYGREYWAQVRGDDLPPGLDYAVFDMAVNSGPGRASKLLQNLVGAKTDGVIGPATLRLVQAWYKDRGAANCIAAYIAAREHYLRALPHFDVYGKGWLRRTSEVLKAANRIASEAANG